MQRVIILAIFLKVIYSCETHCFKLHFLVGLAEFVQR